MTDEFEIDFPRQNGENLHLLSVESSLLYERRICELSELADSLVLSARELSLNGLDVTEILSFIGSEISFSESEVHEDAMKENLSRLAVGCELTDSCDKAVFAEILIERLRASGISIGERSFLPRVDREERFVYVKNAFSDEAYDVFSQDFSDPRLKYVKSFRDAVRAVLDGEASYALLPLEEAGGTRLPTVTELIYRNDLKISAVTPVFGSDGTAELKYALVCKKLTPPDISRDDDRYLEIRISALDVSKLFDLMLAARMYGAEVYRINTATFNREDGEDSFFSVVLRGEGFDFTGLFTYLTLFTDDFTAVGMYKNLE